MSADRPRSYLPIYVIVLIAVALIVVYVFLRNFRAGEEAASVAPPQAEATTSAKTLDERALAKDMTLVAKGKGLFQINCATCHGPEGYGDGARAASLVPKPRNYHTEQFKFGNDIVSIHTTILKGSPGTSMPSFALLPIEDVWAMAHYVYSLVPSPPPITDAQLASLPGGMSGGAAATTTAAPGSTTTGAAPVESTAVRIPIEIAMQLMTVPAPASPRVSEEAAFASPGGAIYTERCAMCHGSRGEGKVMRVLAVAPYRYEVTRDLASSNSPWITDRNKFSQIVVQGLAGTTMPGQATLTSAQLDDLFSFVRSLANVR